MRNRDGHHEHRRHYLAVGIIFGAFLLVLAAGVVLSVSALVRLEAAPDGSLRTGEWTTELEQAFEEALPVYRPALHLWTAVRYAVFGEGGRGLVVGEEGWLFTAEELEIAAADAERVAQAADYIRSVREELERRDAALLVALVPSKARIYEDRLGGHDLPTSVAARYDRLRSLIDAPVPDLRPALHAAREAGTQVFLRTDTHWTPAGARVAAEAVAEPARAVLDKRGVDRTPFETAAGGRVTHRGDLLRFLPLGPFAKRLGPGPEPVTRFETVAGGATAGGPGNTGGGLFDDPSIPVTLVGTSYSAGELWNFTGALSRALEADVLTVAAEGKGPFAPMQEYLESDTIADQPPVLVIWEIPERYLIRDLPG